MTRERTVHSGSRWEPALSSGGPPAVSVVDQGRRRRRRGPVLAALVALLAIGGGSAGIAQLSSDSPVTEHRPGDGRRHGVGHQPDQDHRSVPPTGSGS